MKAIEHLSRIYAGTRMGKEVFRIEDDLGEIIVTQRGNKRVLSFGTSYEQSSVYMNKPYYLSHKYTQIMLLGLIFVNAKHTTLLGLGGGGLAHCLSHYFPEMKIQVVELRQAVIDIAYEWFELPKTENLQVQKSDAFQYIKTMKAASTDLIMSDLYEAHGVSEIQLHANFIESAHHALSDDGCLVLNFHDQPESNSPVIQKIYTLFSRIYVCDVFKGNRILFCCKQRHTFDSNEIKQKTKSLVNTVNMPLLYYAKQLKLLSFS